MKKDQKINELGIDLGNKDQTISSLRGDLNTKISENSTLRSNLNSKDRAYSSLQTDLSNERQENRRLESRIDDKSREINNLNSRLNDKSREVRNLQSRLNDKCRENSRLQSSLNYFEAIESFENEMEMKRDVHVSGSCRMGYSKKNEAFDTVKRAFDLKSNDNDRAEYIRDHFDYKYGKSWNCIVGKSVKSQVYYRGEDLIELSIGNRNVILFRDD